MTYAREPVLQPVPIESLRPTQITVGMREVEEKRKRLRKQKPRKIGGFIRPPHDTGRAGAEKAPLRHRPPSSFAGAAQRGIAGRSRHRRARPQRARARRLLERARSQKFGLSLRSAGPPPGFCRHPEDRHALWPRFSSLVPRPVGKRRLALKRMCKA